MSCSPTTTGSRPSNDGHERSYDGVHLIIGIEVTTRYKSLHCLGIDEPLISCDLAWVFPYEDELDISPQFYIDWVRNKGGIGFIAHPDHEGSPRFHVKQFNWNDWSVTGYTGMGIWDFMTDWQGQLTGFARALLSYYWPAYMLKGPKKETLRRWDELNRARRVVGIASSTITRPSRRCSASNSAFSVQQGLPASSAPTSDGGEFSRRGRAEP